MKPARILLADDHEVVRRGLRALLDSQPQWQVVGEADNGRDALRLATSLKPDVVVLDVGLPQLNGLEAARQIKVAVPRTRILILTMYDSERIMRDALNAGVRGYLLKSDAGRDLVGAVEALLANKTYFTSKLEDILLERYMSGKGMEPDAEQPSTQLTTREREILQLLCEGKSNKEAAAALGISPKTAEVHRANIMRRLSLGSFSDLVRYAIRNGIVTP